jgi:hypothetical protein
MARAIALGVLAALTCAGCATMANTPAQDLAWERWRSCDRFTSISLERIEMDGRLIVTGYESEAVAFSACVRETAADQTRRGVVVAMPPSLVLVKIFGCNGGPT